MALRVWFPTFPCRVCLSKCLLWVWLPDIPCRVCLSNVRCSSHHTADGSSGLAPAISMSSLPLECSLCRATTLLMALVSDRDPTSAHYTKRAHFCDSSSWDAFGRLSSLALGLSMSGLAPERSICVIVAVDRFPNLCSIVRSSSSLALVSSQLQEVIPVSSRERIPYQTHSCAGLTFPALASLSVHILSCVAKTFAICGLRLSPPARHNCRHKFPRSTYHHHRPTVAVTTL